MLDGHDFVTVSGFMNITKGAMIFTVLAATNSPNDL
jgi:hypothetical protein